MPSEEELFKKYNPDLQKKSLENRQQKQEEFDHFVNKLKEYSKSDKHSTFSSPLLYETFQYFHHGRKGQSLGWNRDGMSLDEIME